MADCDRRLFVGHGDAVVVQLAQVCLFVGIKCRISMSGRCTDDGCDCQFPWRTGLRLDRLGLDEIVCV
jgi:hypothetical protein